MLSVKKHIAAVSICLIRLVLVLLWVPVAVDKLWDPVAFHGILLRQPFPDWWADVLFWLLPLLELLAAVLLAWPKRQPSISLSVTLDAAQSSRRGRIGKLSPLYLGLWLSALLLLGFTLFILFGVLGWYAQRPCGCGSVISGLSWEQHLWFNAGFLTLSIIGIWLSWPGDTDGRYLRYRNPLRLFLKRGAAPIQHIYHVSIRRIHFPRKFAVFRRGA